MTSATPNQPKTLYDKVFDAHVVCKDPSGSYLLYIDRQLLHEVTSPQAFEGLRNAGRKVRRIDCTLATVDHNIPTDSRKSFKSVSSFIDQHDSRLQVETLEQNVKDFHVPYLGMTDGRQGIVHVVGPEQGFTLPGTTVVCGDSHTSTHGAFGALAFGIGTSEVEHVLATQTIIQTRSKNMRIRIEGDLNPGVTSKDLVLHLIHTIGTAGGTGCVIEFAGKAIRDLSVEARMSICNMSIEGGARAGMIQPDEKTFAYVKGRPLAPKGAEWDKALSYWKTLYSDPDAKFDREVVIEAKDIVPTITWGNSPQDALPITSKVPDPEKISDKDAKQSCIAALEYMGLKPNTPLQEIYPTKIFIGSCTNSRLEDLREAAKVARGHHIAKNIKRALVVPGSCLVKKQAEDEGLDKIFKEAGFEWREAGCSMCLGMNTDILSPYERCASTSNRNFRGRQGPLSRTHLMSPAMVAAAAVVGHFTDIRKFDYIVPKDEPKVKIDARAEFESAVAKAEERPAIPEVDIEGNKEASSEIAKENPSEENSGMAKFSTVTSVAAPLTKQNIDTDAIIPKQFLKTIKRTGLKKGLFYEARFKADANGKMVPTDFPLNVPPYNHAQILVVTGKNFGCGSSREHAPWALKDFGIKSIIAPSFGDIFYNNSFKNGLLPIRIPQEIIQKKLYPLAVAKKQITVDLPNQQILDDKGEVVIPHFEVEEFRKHCLINGLDDIAITLQKTKYIDAYEATRRDRFSFLEGGSTRLLKSASEIKVGSGASPADW